MSRSPNGQQGANQGANLARTAPREQAARRGTALVAIADFFTMFALLLAVFACLHGIDAAAGAVLTGISSTMGSVLGGTKVWVTGSGFLRKGRDGQTNIFIGNQL